VLVRAKGGILVGYWFHGQHGPGNYFKVDKYDLVLKVGQCYTDENGSIDWRGTSYRKDGFTTDFGQSDWI